MLRSGMSRGSLPALHRALKFALNAHKGQDRDGPSPLPYITHPFEVVNVLRYIGGVTDERVLVSTALHDVLEETDVTAEEIEEKFGDDVLRLVKEVTRREPSADEIVNLDEDQIWVLRTRIFLDEIRQMSEQAWQIKLADRYSNLGNAFYTRSPKKLERYVWQSILILEIIPRTANPQLWDGVQAMIDRVIVTEDTKKRLAL